MRADRDYTYELCEPTDAPLLEELYHIYEQSLPQRERRPKAEIFAAAARSDYRVLLVKRDRVVIGFSMIFLPPEQGFGLVEYMAVRSADRSAGIGGELFRRTIQIALASRGGIPVLVEVDSDRQRSSDQPLRRRRQQFYRRLGCRRVDGLSYLLPLPGEGPAPEMDLFVCLPANAPPIRKSLLAHWLAVVYERVYHCSPDDPRLREMLESVADPVVLV